MFYCFDDLKNLPYNISFMLEYAKYKGLAIIYNGKEDKFFDALGNEIDILGKKIYPKTGIYQEDKLCDAIERHGGISLSTKKDNEICINWPSHYKTKRKLNIYSGFELQDTNILNKIKEEYGSEIFFKTLFKNYSTIVPVDYLLDKETVISRCIKAHENEKYIISEKVEIKEDELGKREYRIFVIEGKIVSISRFADHVFHKIDKNVYDKSLEIVNSLNNFPSSYVIDVFEYEKDSNTILDVLEFNPLPASGTYLYNSLFDLNNSDILHENIYNIAEEKISALDAIKEANIKTIKYDERNSVAFNVPGGFAYDLRCIFMSGKVGGFIFDGIKSVSREQLGSHESLFGNIFDDELVDDSKKTLKRTLDI